MPTPPVTAVSVTIINRTGAGAIGTPTEETVHYLVQYTTPNHLAMEVYSAYDGTTQIPQAFAILSSTYYWLYLLKVVPTQRTEDPCFWDVICTYSGLGVQQQQPKPAGATKYNVDISGTLVPRQIEVSVDNSNGTIANAAGDPITGITRTAYDEQINVSYHTLAPDWTTIDTCKGATNNAAITLTINGSARVLATNSFKLENVNWSLVYAVEQLKTVRMDLVFMYRKETWRDMPANIGYNKKDSNGTLAAITLGDVNTANGVAVGAHATDIKNTPTFLNLSGGILPNGSTATIAVDSTSTPGFQIPSMVSFTTLLAEITT